MSSSGGPLFKSKASPLRRPGAQIKREGTPGSRPPPQPSVKQEPGVKTEAPADGTTSGGFHEVVLRSCTSEEIKEKRHHVLKFHSRNFVDPNKFTQPIRFHRKDPRNLQFQMTVEEQQKMDQESKAASSSTDGNTAEPANPKADMSSVAPDGGGRRSHHPFQKKTRQVMAGNENSRKLRYEEHYPWVMEDFDGKNTWVGSYEAAQSDTYALFVIEDDGFKMIPAEKWYRMTPRNKYATLTIEEAEEKMEKKKSVPRWIMRHIDEDDSGQVVDAGRRRRLRTVDGNEPVTRGGEDIDYDDEFADDEEAPIMEGAEEDVKAVEDKIKKEMRAAPAIGPQDEDDGNLDELFGEDEPKMGKEGRKLKKYLRSLEKNTYYDSDEEENPYASSETDSDEGEQVKTEDPGVARSASPGARPDSTTGGAPAPIQYKPLVKKEYKNLPPGMVIIQLPSQLLAGFPRDVWNPNAKRRRESSPQDAGAGSPTSDTQVVKKIKTEDGSPGPQGSSTAVNGDGNDVLTEEDVRSIISTRQVRVPELLALLKPKLKKDAENQKRLRKILRSIAKLQNDVLVLKDPKA